ncbi:hypothetical protein RchiOBHm_Chr7g0203361 [Rosa chinensis]|uniref:Uncharacterized protein n=1 Tax=Rosa chinensis TaxID=74649 RepID=A0A2P6P8D3_ROSCH|nr:hypothetical protein RchiOBHm_Chr7g0203361 [Rosa chinensis]
MENTAKHILQIMHLWTSHVLGFSDTSRLSVSKKGSSRREEILMFKF